MATKKARAASA